MKYHGSALYTFSLSRVPAGALLGGQFLELVLSSSDITFSNFSELHLFLAFALFNLSM